MKKPLKLITAGTLAIASLLAAPITTRAADHADGPTVANDQGVDLADVYAFLDPTDNSKTVLIFTWRGFIVPGEAVNLTVFDPATRFRFEIENTGDAKPDKHIDITFGPKESTTVGQKVFFQMTGMKKPLEAIGTVPTLGTTAPTPAVTTLDIPGGSVDVFAGLVDDPFFFDIPAFARFVPTVVAKAPDLTILNRGRDTFAGYNVLSVAVRLPSSLLLSSKPNASTKIGVSVLAQRHATELNTTKGVRKGIGAFRTVDREGIPGVNAVLLPLKLRDAYNASHPSKDPNKNPNKPSEFTKAILATLEALGTNEDGVTLLANLAVAKGDYLRLETNATTTPNSGPDGGTNAAGGFAALNGRRPADDVIDTVLSVISNGAVTEGDNVDGNDAEFLDVFPFLALPHMPLPAGQTDPTQN